MSDTNPRTPTDQTREPFAVTAGTALASAIRQLGDAHPLAPIADELEGE